MATVSAGFSEAICSQSHVSTTSVYLHAFAPHTSSIHFLPSFAFDLIQHFDGLASDSTEVGVRFGHFKMSFIVTTEAFSNLSTWVGDTCSISGVYIGSLHLTSLFATP